MKAQSATIAGIALLGSLLSAPAAAQTGATHPELTDRFRLELGVYFPKVKTTASLNAAGIGGTTVDFESMLGLEDNRTMGTFLAGLRLGERWKLEAEYFQLQRSGTRALNAGITWGGITYAAGTVVSSEFDSSTFRLSVGYSFIKTPQMELGASLGLHATDFNAGISATGVGAAGGDTLAPLPVLGLYGAYAFSPKWLVGGRVDFFSLGYGDYDGSLVDASARIDYRFHRHFGVGISYRYVDYDVELTRGSFNGAINYRFTGPMVYLVGSF